MSAWQDLMVRHIIHCIAHCHQPVLTFIAIGKLGTWHVLFRSTTSTVNAEEADMPRTWVVSLALLTIGGSA
jgi:hypothetical protein